VLIFTEDQAARGQALSCPTRWQRR